MGHAADMNCVWKAHELFASLGEQLQELLGRFCCIFTMMKIIMHFPACISEHELTGTSLAEAVAFCFPKTLKGMPG